MELDLKNWSLSQFRSSRTFYKEDIRFNYIYKQICFAKGDENIYLLPDLSLTIRNLQIMTTNAKQKTLPYVQFHY